MRELARQMQNTSRLSVYERKLEGTARWTLKINPPDSMVRLVKYDEDLLPLPAKLIDPVPSERSDISPGDYLLICKSQDRADLLYPLKVSRNAQIDLDVKLLPRNDVPAGMVYVPAGPFIYGAPHQQKTVDLLAFFIDRTEVTGAEYEKIHFRDPWRPSGQLGGKDYLPRDSAEQLGLQCKLF
jgi:hypothetical protein